MKKRLLISLLTLSTVSFGQETLFQDNFESGASNWTLNGGTGDNAWIVNNAYQGITTPISIPDTPNQPAGINNSPQSYYLHIYSSTYGPMFGALNANFVAGINSNQDAVQMNSVSTTGKTDVTFNYWYVCAGAAGVSEGKVYYSVDNGTNWVLLATHSGVTNWTQASHSLPAWNNQSTLKFKFNWTNGGTGNDPSFAVDDVLLTAENAGAATEITNVTLSDSNPWCESIMKTMDVSFTASGTYQSDNVFYVELSDGSGNFTAPEIIGSLSSSSTGTLTIPSIIPVTVLAGSNYRIRVRSTNEVAVSADNGVGLVINPFPTVTLPAFSNVCVNHEAFALTTGTPAGGDYFGTGVSGNTFTPSVAGTGTWTISYSYTDANNCVNTTSASIVVDACLSIETVAAEVISVYPNPVIDKLYIDGTGVKKVVIYDLLGKEVITFGKTQTSYDLNALNRGTYFVKVITENSDKTFKVLVK